MSLQDIFNKTTDYLWTAKSFSDFFTSKTRRIQDMINYISDAVTGNPLSGNIPEWGTFSLLLKFKGYSYDDSLNDGDYVTITPNAIMIGITSMLDSNNEFRDGFDGETNYFGVFNGLGGSGVMSLNEIVSQLTGSVCELQIVSAALDALSNVNNASVSDYLTIFKTYLGSKFDSIPINLSSVVDYCTDILADNCGSIFDRVQQIVNLITSEKNTVTDTDKNDELSEYTGLTVWTALSLNASQWYNSVSKVVAIVSGTLTSWFNQLTQGLIQNVWDTTAAVLNIQGVYKTNDKYEINSFDNFCTTIKNFPTASYPNLKSKLITRGGYFTFDTPSARMYISANDNNGDTCTVIIQWKLILPRAFDQYICSIKDKQALGLSTYLNAPVLNSIYHTNPMTLCDDLFAASNASKQDNPANNLETYEAIWLAQYCLALYIGCVYCVNNNISDITTAANNFVVLGVLFTYSDYASYTDNSQVGNYTIANQLRSGASYYDYNNFSATAKAMTSLLLYCPEQAASDAYYLAYAYSRRIAHGKYFVLTDSNINALSITVLSGTAIALSIAVGFIAKAGIKKALFKMQNKCSTLAFNCWNATTGQLTDPNMLHKAYKANKVSNILESISSGLGQCFSSLLSNVKNTFGNIVSSCVSGVRNVLNKDNIDSNNNFTSLTDVNDNIDSKVSDVITLIRGNVSDES